MVNIRNDGTLPFLADDPVIEVAASVDASGARARCRSRRPSRCTPGSIAARPAYERLALDAALRGGRDRVFAGPAGPSTGGSGRPGRTG